MAQKDQYQPQLVAPGESYSWYDQQHVRDFQSKKNSPDYLDLLEDIKMTISFNKKNEEFYSNSELGLKQKKFESQQIFLLKA